MVLSKQNISIPLTNGIDTKTDDKQLVVGNFTVLENTMFKKPGKLIKRKGYESIILKDSSDDNITDGVLLAKYKEELNLFTESNLYSRIASIDKWSNKGNVFTIVPESKEIVRTNVEQSNLDSNSTGGLNIFTWEDSNGIGLSLVDNESKNFIISRQILTATGTNPKVVVRDGDVYILYVDTTAIKYRKFSIYDYNNIDAEVTAVAVIAAGSKHYDTVLSDDRIIIAYAESVGAALSFVAIKSDDTVTGVTTVAGELPSVTVNLVSDAASRIICTYYDGTDAKIVVFNYTLGTKILAETSLETIANVTNITAIETSVGNYTALYEISAVATYNHYIKKQTVDLAGTTGTPEVLLRSVGLASKLFVHDGSYQVAVIHSNTLQSTYFLIDTDGNVVSKIAPDTGGDLISSGGLPRVSSMGDDKYLLANQAKGRLVESNGTFFSLLGVNSTVLDFSPETQFQNTTLASNMHIAGGFLKMYDGIEVVEHGFHVYPEGLANGGTAATGGVLSDGTYQYKAVYAWTDAQGILHRSAPSVGFSVTLSGGGTLQKQTITVPTLRITDKSDVIIELYRTEASGTVFYKVTSTTSPTANDTAVDSVSILDSSVSDASLISNELLYTTGGELENLPAQACSIIENFKSRIFTTTPGSRKINYSKIVFEGFPVEFNDTLEINIPDEGGDNISIRKMDDKLIILKKESIYYISGDGPNNLGEQDTFIKPELISSDIGCVEDKSVIFSPIGMMFKSEKGIYLLSRSLSLQYIGAPVEEFNDLSITSSILVPDSNQIRFTTSDGDCLVYNYAQGKWSTYANHKALSAINISSNYYYLRSGTLLYKEDDSFNDNGSLIKMKIESGWISFGGVQGYQRIYKIMILGTYKTSHKLKVRIAYDFNESFIQEEIIDPSNFIDSNIYGSGSTYGSDEYYGGDGTPYQARVDLTIQKCQSIKISIEDLPQTEGEGVELSNIMFKIGVKAKEGKIQESQQFGTE